MPTLDELHAAVRAAREEVRAAIESAGEAWERQPTHGEGEEAWSPRQVAEHIVSTEGIYATRMCVLAGHPGVEELSPSFATPRDAAAGLISYGDLLDQKTAAITESDLSIPHDRLTNIEGFFHFRVRHLRDHANQIRLATAD